MLRLSLPYQCEYPLITETNLFLFIESHCCNVKLGSGYEIPRIPFCARHTEEKVLHGIRT